MKALLDIRKSHHRALKAGCIVGCVSVISLLFMVVSDKAIFRIIFSFSVVPFFTLGAIAWLTRGDETEARNENIVGGQDALSGRSPSDLYGSSKFYKDGYDKGRLLKRIIDSDDKKVEPEEFV